MDYARSCPDDPEAELAARTLARRSLLDFTTYTYPAYIAEPMHVFIAAYLDRVLAGEIAKLLIFCFPQSGKSELVSVRFPAFWLAHRPEDPVILTSYGASLASAKSWESRNVVESPAFRSLFPGIRTDQTSRAKDHWRLAGRRGGVIAAGVGGAITGHGAQLGIIDDPFENWAQAHSSAVRKRVWDWYRGTFRTRIWEDGAIIVMASRWHELDLAGMLLQEEPGQWTVLRMSALAETQAERDEVSRRIGLPMGRPDWLNREPGESLCPQRFSREALLAIQADVGSVVWGAEYQGAPRAAEGEQIKRAWLDVNKEYSIGDAWRVRYWDKAGTAGGGSYTAGVLMAYIVGEYCVEDVVRGQWSAGEREDVIEETAVADVEKYGHVLIWIEQEPGSGGKESAESTLYRLSGYPVQADRPTGSKDVRLAPFRVEAEKGGVCLARGSWNRDYVDELCAVPFGRTRDQADATAGAFNKLAEVVRKHRLVMPIGRIFVGARRDGEWSVDDDAVLLSGGERPRIKAFA